MPARTPCRSWGLLTEWSLGKRLWDALKQTGLIEQTASKNVLYTLDPHEKSLCGDPRVRLLKAEEFNAWNTLYQEYVAELKLPPMLSETEQRAEFKQRCRRQIVWGLFEKDTLASIANLNAQAGDLGQVGGVYTLPAHRP